MTPFLPNFCDVRALLALVLGSLYLALMLSLAGDPGDGFWAGLGLRGLFIAWVALLSALVLCACRRLLNQLPVGLQSLVVLVLIGGVTFLISCLVLAGLPGMGIHIQLTPETEGLSYGRNLGIALLVSVALLHYFHLQFRWRQQVQAESEARLQALQARMRPHFLFNSLNSIAQLIATDSAAAEDRLADLAESLRAALALDSRKLVPLTEEVDLTRHYLSLEQARLGTRLQIHWRLDPEAMAAKIPPFSLQPLAENAVYYGIEPASGGGKLEISTSRQKDYLLLSVRNTLPESSARKRQGNRIALANLKARLAACFQDQARLWVSTADGWYQVRLRLPVQQSD